MLLLKPLYKVVCWAVRQFPPHWIPVRCHLSYLPIPAKWSSAVGFLPVWTTHRFKLHDGSRLQNKWERDMKWKIRTHVPADYGCLASKGTRLHARRRKPPTTLDNVRHIFHTYIHLYPHPLKQTTTTPLAYSDPWRASPSLIQPVWVCACISGRVLACQWAWPCNAHVLGWMGWVYLPCCHAYSVCSVLESLF